MQKKNCLKKKLVTLALFLSFLSVTTVKLPIADPVAVPGTSASGNDEEKETEPGIQPLDDNEVMDRIKE